MSICNFYTYCLIEEGPILEHLEQHHETVSEITGRTHKEKFFWQLIGGT